MRGRSAALSATGSRPSTRTLPPSGRRYPSHVSTVVVFPAPFGPSTAATVPRPTARSTPPTATLAPYRLTRPTPSPTGCVCMDRSLRPPPPPPPPPPCPYTPGPRGQGGARSGCLPGDVGGLPPENGEP